ncbi:ZRT1 [Candida oxycetoniae]|uniref:ZRT1 n=1 Tax=Candida oxycetoniae TaxID=497107 RepID=A0AAI9WWQ9_9ASCO|nr:ZRT1 [Candida oxycetoniae]KAI3403506.2 ZRT1 [Candida oxycetoniae]
MRFTNAFVVSALAIGSFAVDVGLENAASLEIREIESGEVSVLVPKTRQVENKETTFSVNGCHFHGDVQYCLDADGNEGYIDPVPKNAPESYTGCHSHGNETFCMNGDDEVQFIPGEKDTESDDDHDHEHEHEDEHEHEHEEDEDEGATFSVDGCHFHDDVQYCLDADGNEGYIDPVPKNAPESYTGCHSHGNETFCMNGDEEVQFILGEKDTEATTSGTNCHFHAGVEHCVDDNENKDTETCEKVDRDYNIPIRIGALFAILVTSAIGSFGPMVLKSLFKLNQENIFITIVKQFGTGVVISTAFVHLMTHAALVWANSCLHIGYEAVGPAITIAGIFVAFIVEYIAYRLLSKSLKSRSTVSQITASGDVEQKIESQEQTLDESSDNGNDLAAASHHNHGLDQSVKDKISVFILECGIIFHSILIGLTLVVAGDSYFITLFIVIVFHQFFEGLALGSRIADIRANLLTKLSMAGAFAIITPIGMAIGVGVLHKFNGNDVSTIIALGTLDSFSAGVLLWTGLIEMWAHDWLDGHLRTSNWIHTSLAMVSLIAGLLLMSLLGNWA